MSGHRVYVASRNENVEPQDGLGYYQCDCSLGWSSFGREDMAAHFREKHDGQGRFAEDAAGLDEMLRAYKKQVEREFAEALCSLFKLVAEAKRKNVENATDGGMLIVAGAELNAMTEAIESIRVMADLPVET